MNRTRLRDFLSAILTVLLLCTALGASAQSKHDSLTIGMVEFPQDMHPFITNQLVRSYVHGFARRGVTRFTAEGELVCDLCSEVPSIANGRAVVTTQPDGKQSLSVRFTLRPGLVWGDGVAITSRDILLGFNALQMFAPEPGLIGVKIIDDANYSVEFDKARYDFARLSPDPLPEHLEGAIFRAAKDGLDYGRQSLFNRAPATPGLWNGPYLVDRFTPGELVSFKPNPYWTGTKPYFQTITLKLIENTAALLANLLSGDIDMANGLTFDQALALGKDHSAQFDVRFIPSLSVAMMVPNFSNPQLADKRVRQAILLGIDRKTLVAKLFEGHAPVADGMLAPAERSRDPNIKKYAYDPAAARALLAAAGYKPGPDKILVGADGKRLSIDLAGASGVRLIELVEQVIQSQLRAIGVEIVVRNEPPRVLLGETVRKRTFQGLIIFTSLPGPDWIPYARLHSSRIPSPANNLGGSNYGGYSNPTLDAALSAAQIELDPAKRQVLWNEIQMIEAEELPVLPLYHPAAVFIEPRWMTGMLPPKSLTLPSLAVENWKVK
jgi:peptide/nickel transport system substrate-binding protein